MLANGLFGGFFAALMLRRILRLTAGLFLGLGFLYWVVERGGMENVEVVIQVEESDVEVSVDRKIYRIVGQRDHPILCDLAPGRHELVMRRGAEVLFVDSFVVRPGANVVRSAYDPRRMAPPPSAPGEAR